MIEIQKLNEEQVQKLSDIDRSEFIDLIYEMQDGNIVEIQVGHECPNWDKVTLKEIQDRFRFELRHGGTAVGAFNDSRLVGFGVLSHKFRGMRKDHLQIDLMYVSREYRRQGIGSRIMESLSNEARRRGAKYLYISSTETRSAVSFYRSHSSYLTREIDQELFDKEPKDIHMVIEL
ncbi:GNAT family N-acetyltransferase [Paenibacillus puerhi]|uniref:GNAT family N-acetyltransferase n=1 Tax=Paenibacillus puerhi TaxID=2692622 RepID=UPI00135947FD|nr:GNAT family N-acetyltransferase [Paenibacillus puerhi]